MFLRIKISLTILNTTVNTFKVNKKLNGRQKILEIPLITIKINLIVRVL